MNKEKMFKCVLHVMLLVIVSLTFTSCKAFLGGNITFGYFVGCIVYGAIGLVAGGLIWYKAYDMDCDNEVIGGCGFVVVSVCSILPFLWRPMEKFNFVMLVVNVALGIMAIIVPVVFGEVERAQKEQARQETQAAKEQERTQLRTRLAEAQKELGVAMGQKEDLSIIIEKQGEVCLKAETFRNLANSLAESLKKGEEYEITRFSAIESCLQTFNDLEKYVPDFALAEFMDSCKLLDEIIGDKLDADVVMQREDRRKFTQMHEKLRGFLSRAHKSEHREKVEDSALEALRRRILDLNSTVGSLTEQLHAAERS